MKKIDTHFHTKLSDWSRTNNDVLKESREKWINFISATEHDIINDELSLLANMNWLSNSLWVEISAVDNEVTWKSLHLTCYSDHFCDEIRSILENTREKRKLKIMKQVEKLESLWFNINYEKFIRFYKNLDVNIDNINNFHIEDYIFQNEDNIDRFLPWVIEALYWFYDENLFEIIFKLDEQAKEYLQRKEIKERIEKILL